ncbi:TetR/AcrR family transcriptional regulator [Pseudalkalibacillus caeni]|uniref:TetR/AcrR family transcriptional regulator n=1 Tax=Exobacillus caeni TaxID=2574798 RepID=A0A5R9F6I4_9BACL|nr:TetR/AcrR family transcriptional regulator [Pseudalkalibacillus caeni]TLS39177.1 TetR/AcrR family transcriptional regulator [Pseudalkalibacillus caeni]
MTKGKKRGPKYDKIIDAAVKVIAEHGYHQAQVSKIAKAAGVADGTIYLYFKNKEDLLISLFQKKMGSFIEKTEMEILLQKSPDEMLLSLIQMHFKQLSEDYDLAIVTQLELRQTNKQLRAKIGDVLKRYLALVDSILQKGKESSVFDESLDIRLARQMIFGTLDETVTNWVMNDHKFDLVALAKPIHRLLINGLSNK